MLVRVESNFRRKEEDGNGKTKNRESVRSKFFKKYLLNTRFEIMNVRIVHTLVLVKISKN